MLAGYFIPDVIVAATIGVVTGWCLGPLVPLIGHYLARSIVIQSCLHLTVAAMALSSQFFPYSTSAPKRVVLQHTYRTAGVVLIVFACCLVLAILVNLNVSTSCVITLWNIFVQFILLFLLHSSLSLGNAFLFQVFYLIS